MTWATRLTLAVLANPLAALLADFAPARAAETQWWTQNTAADHARSESRGVVVDPDGVLRLGLRAVSYPADTLGVAWCAVVLRDGSVAVGSDRGRVLRWSERGGWKLWARLDAGQVLSLAADGDQVVAGTGPHGVLYSIRPTGDTARLAVTGERYIWALAPAGRGAWYAASGTRGRLLRVSGSRSEIVLDTEESNLVSLVSDGNGGVYAGGDSRGRVYHVSSSGTARTLFDATEDEVRALARDAQGVVWAAALSASAATMGSGSPATGEEPAEEEGPRPVRAAAAGGKAVLYRITPEGAVSSWWTAPQPFVFALAHAPSGLLAATGNRAGVYRVERANGATLELAPPQGQVTALVSSGESVYALTSNPVTLWKLGPGSASDGELTSGVLDAARFSRFGRLRSSGSGQRSFSTRSGNSETPDTTWTRWQAIAGDGSIASPPGRFLQWKVRLGDRDDRVSEVAISRREPNLAPRVEELTVAPQAQGFREGGLSSRTETVTQTLPGGQKVEYSALLTASRSLQEMPLWARGLRTLTWRGSDPNGDPLRYRVLVRAEGSEEWIEIGKDLEASMLTWNTNTLPDGRYRLQVHASDRQGNAIGEELTSEAVSEPFAVDNTPPQVTSLTASTENGRALLSGAAADGEGWLQRLDVSVDDGPWRPASPEGDSRTLPGSRSASRCRRWAPARTSFRCVRWTRRATPPRVRCAPWSRSRAEPHVASSRMTALEPAALALLLTALFGGLGSLGDWRAELGRYQFGLLVAFGVYALALARRAHWRALPRAGAFVLVVAFALRAAVLPQPPTLSDDMHRYVWEGRVLAAGANPWRHAPSDPALEPLRDRSAHPHVNHSTLRAIYPPLAELGFALVAKLSATHLAFKLWVMLHDLALCALLVWWCRRRGGSAWDAAVYAWNPLIITEYAGSGHHDPTGIVWLVLALALADRRPVGSALSASASALVKLVSLAAVPFLWREWTARARITAALVLGVSLSLYAGLALGPDSGLTAFATRWRHNDALFGFLTALSGERGARGLALGLVVAVTWLALRARVSSVDGTRLLLRAGLLLGPVVHPWYLGWVLALEPLAPSPAWLLLSSTVTLGYGTFAPPAAGGAYHPDAGTRLIEYGAPLLLAAILFAVRRRGGTAPVRETARGRPA